MMLNHGDILFGKSFLLFCSECYYHHKYQFGYDNYMRKAHKVRSCCCPFSGRKGREEA